LASFARQALGERLAARPFAQLAREYREIVPSAQELHRIVEGFAR
jgi:hypothetical protein